MGSSEEAGESAEVELSLDIADTGVDDGNTIEATEAPSQEAMPASNPSRRRKMPLPSRPQMRRNQSLPPPPQQSPLPPPDEQPATQNDSLSLAQLRRIITDMPKPEARAYDFTYHDADCIASELEEWFSYAGEEQTVLLGHHEVFTRHLQDFLKRTQSTSSQDVKWKDVQATARQEFVLEELKGLKSRHTRDQRASLQSLLYIVFGVWMELDIAEDASGSGPLTSYAVGLGEERACGHLDAIQHGVHLILDCDGVQPVYDRLRDACLREQ